MTGLYSAYTCPYSLPLPLADIIKDEFRKLEDQRVKQDLMDKRLGEDGVYLRSR